MVDDQQEATRRHGARRLLQDVDAGKLYRRVQVLGGDQVEGAWGEGEGEVVLPEVDAVGDTSCGRVCRRPIKGRGGYVDGGHAPALPGEPDCVAPFAAAEVQRGARTQASDDVDQDGGRSPAPHASASAVMVLPKPLGLHVAVAFSVLY